VIVLLGPALAALASFVMLPAVRQAYGLRDGERTTGTFRTDGRACLFGGCRIEFEAAGGRVVAGLPPGDSAKGYKAGDPVVIRYRTADPTVMVPEGDTGYAEAVLMVGLPGLPALILLVAGALRLGAALRV
jgi:hypothetical protein